MNLLEQLNQDRSAAFAAKDPCAGLCYFATTNEANQPEVRTLVLRDVDERLAIFINASSPKWHQLKSNGNVAVLIYLASLGVQYRLSATLQPIDKSVVDESWQLRPDTPKHLDWFYESVQPQSSKLAEDADLVAMARDALPTEPLVAPPGAQGLFLMLNQIERLDLNSEGGPHQRDIGKLDASNNWQHHRLVP